MVAFEKNTYILPIPIFDFGVIVCLGTLKEFLNEIKHHKIPKRDLTPKMGISGCVLSAQPFIRGKNRFRIAMYIDVSEMDLPNTINHECSHIVDEWFEYIFEDVTGTDQKEMAAYFHAYLNEEIKKIVVKHLGVKHLTKKTRQK